MKCRISSRYYLNRLQYWYYAILISLKLTSLIWFIACCKDCVLLLRAIPLKIKKQEGEETLRDPLGQNWDFFTPLGPPSDPKQDFFNPPQTFFRQFYPPRTPFLETPLIQKIAVLYPQDKNKDFQYPPRTGRFDPLEQKGHFLPPPLLFF